MFLLINRFRATALCVAACLLATGCSVGDSSLGTASGQGVNAFNVTRLVGSSAAIAPHVDPQLVNPWVIAYSPTGPIWVCNRGSGTATVYDGLGAKQPITVSIPAVPGHAGHGTVVSVAFNPTNGFELAPGKPAVFIFCTEEGLICGWSPQVNSSQAVVMVDRSIYYPYYEGMTLVSAVGNNYIAATSFRINRVEVFNDSWVLKKVASDPNADAGYSTYGIQVVGSQVFVTFAKQDVTKHNVVTGPGFGFIDIVDELHATLNRFANHATLNAPYSVTQAPDTFAAFSDAVLVSNTGDGTIDAFDPASGRFLGQMKDHTGNPVQIPGLRYLLFGNGSNHTAINTLYFTASPSGGADGLLGFFTQPTH